MSSILLLFLCLFIGIALQRVKNFPTNTATVLNQYILYVALPAMALHYLPKIQLSWDLLLPASVAWIAFGLSFVLFHFLGSIYKWSKKLTGCLIITSGLGNTSFVGIPIIQALYGEEGLNTLIIVDLPGTFVVLSTVGVLVATLYSNQKKAEASILKKMFTFPPLLAFLVGLIMVLLQIDFPEALSTTFKQLAATISPIALISVGYQLKFKTYGKHFKFLLLGLFFQLVVLPFVILTLFYFVLGKTDLATKVCIIEAAMAPMITGAILASTYGLKPELSNMMVGYGIPLSFVTIAGWYFIVAHLLG
ncbi:AEC family transporter [Flavobacterium sp. CBA20B-1]|uniref:AEC family transporter n=1 Tax=unclassified Flavobacterium TaxID=196869 RepID=UPI00222481C7|nr:MULTISPECIES: AEC family transporter [unclassified Flavobacterium]WCM43173.1 AEC family transporter [Flavobacterium sp. CBA20B-1]